MKVGLEKDYGPPTAQYSEGYFVRMDALIKTPDGNRIGEGFGFMLRQMDARAEITLAGGLDRWSSIKYFAEYVVEVEDGRQLRCFVTRMTPIVIGAKQLVTLDLKIR